MTTFRAVTSCSRKGWDEYGHRMFDSVAEFWPESLPFNLYSEDVIPGLLVKSFPEWLFGFKERHVKNIFAHGRPQGKVGMYNYRYDAVRFAHKTAAVIDTFETMEEDVLIWVDADTVTHSPVTLDFLESLTPTKHGISWLARRDKYPECGFYMLRRDNPMVQKLIGMWKRLYKQDTLFHLPEWHDSFVLQELVKLCGVPARSISGAAGEKTHHPFINSPLGSVMDHMKGPRKKEGRSLERDLKVERTEDYWRRE